MLLSRDPGPPLPTAPDRQPVVADGQFADAPVFWANVDEVHLFASIHGTADMRRLTGPDQIMHNSLGAVLSILDANAHGDRRPILRKTSYGQQQGWRQGKSPLSA